MADKLARHLGGLPPVRVLYTDVDGTLVNRQGSLLHDAFGRPSARAAQALVDADRAGLVVVPVSGRRQVLLDNDARLLGLRDWIAEAGAVVCRDGHVTYEWGQAPRDLGSNPREALRAGGALAAVVDAFPGDLRPFSPWDEGRTGEFLLHGVADVQRAAEALARAGCAWAHLVDNGATTGWPGRSVHAYHLLPRGVGKAQAVTDDLAARGLTREAAAACGDSMEDLTMAGCVGTYLQVANGHGPHGGNVFSVLGEMGEGFADAVEALLSTAARPAEAPVRP